MRLRETFRSVEVMIYRYSYTHSSSYSGINISTKVIHCEWTVSYLVEVFAEERKTAASKPKGREIGECRGK